MQQRVAILAPAHANHDAVAFFDELEVGDATAELACELIFELIFEGHGGQRCVAAELQCFNPSGSKRALGPATEE